MKARSGAAQRSTNLVSDDQNETDQSVSDFDMQELNAVRASVVVPKYLITLKVEGRALEFEVDSGAAVTVISQETYRRTWPNKPPPLQKEDMTLQTWTGEGLRVLGSAQVHVKHKSKDYISCHS